MTVSLVFIDIRVQKQYVRRCWKEELRERRRREVQGHEEEDN